MEVCFKGGITWKCALKGESHGSVLEAGESQTQNLSYQSRPSD